MRRFIALTATAALALALAPFQAALAQAPDQEPPTLKGTIDQPAEGSDLTGAATIKVSLRELPVGHELKSWYVDVRTADGTQSYGLLCGQTFDEYNPQNPNGGNNPDPVTSWEFKWDTNRTSGSNTAQEGCGANTVVPSGGSPSKNGSYRLVLHMKTTTFDPTGQNPPRDTDVDDANVKVTNEPKAPTGVKLSYDQGKKQITIEWNKNNEPDVSKYRLQECIVDKSSKPCDEWKTLADVSSTAASVEASKPNIYRYRVAALRPNAGNQTMVSEYASAKGDPTEIEVKEDPPESTTSSQPHQATAETTPQTPITVTKTVVQPTRRVQRAAPEVVQRIVEEEPGYESKLPYEEGGEAIGGLPIDESGEGEGQRAILIPLAGGALLLVFAMQVHYLNRRAHAGLEPVLADGEWDDDWDE